MPELCLAVCETVADAVQQALPPEALPFVRVEAIPCLAPGDTSRAQAMAALRAARAGTDATVYVLGADTTADADTSHSSVAVETATACPRCAMWLAHPEQVPLQVVHRVAAWSVEQVAVSRAQSSRQLARYALAFEVFGRLPVLEGEKQVVEAVTEMFTALFAPGRLTFTPGPIIAAAFVSPGDESSLPAITWTSPLPWETTPSGFRLRIEQNGTTFGVYELGEFIDPASRDRYLNLATTLTGVIAMAIANARALRGIITICSHCKKIRDDAGGWRSLEGYLMQHTDARFSHGICPTCVDKFYRGEI